MAHIGNSLQASGDIRLYSCNLSSSEPGQEFAQTLSTLTQADIASNNDITGHVALAGDWDLEITQGNVETRNVISPQIQSDWVDTLDIAFGLVHPWKLDGDGTDSTGGTTAQLLNNGNALQLVPDLITNHDLRKLGA